MKLTRKDPFTGNENTHELDITAEEMATWEKGDVYVQDAFPRLTADEREFVKTGIDIGSFDLIFEDKEEEDNSDDEYLFRKSGEGRDEADAIEDENEDDCPEFDEMMRLAKDTGCRIMHCMCAMGDNDHNYDLALKWLIDKGYYTPETAR